MDYLTPRVAAADYLQKHLQTLDLTALDEIDCPSRDKALMRFHVETYLKKFDDILSRAAKHGLIKSSKRVS